MIHATTNAYLDPALDTFGATETPVESTVIVTAKNSTIASRAVQALDGQVISNLWLIDAVSAKIKTNLNFLMETNSFIKTKDALRISQPGHP